MNELPVLITCYKRPDLLEQSLSSLSKSTIPLKLFFHIDGPRDKHPEDLRAINECKKIINTFCVGKDVKIMSIKENLGLRNAMLSAISWFFSQVEYGLILEEDVVLHPQAFSLVLDALKEFQHDHSIGAVSLHNNLSPRFLSGDFDLYLSHIVFIWGWATWRSRWAVTSKGIDKPYERLLRCYTPSKIGWLGFMFFLRFLLNKAKNSWDGDVQLNYLEMDYRTIHFRKNLALNIGFDDRATHTKLPIFQRPIEADNIKSLKEMSRNMSPDRYVEKKLIEQVFGLIGTRIKFQYVKWFVKNWHTFHKN
jgi:glycosyltransferase involved in cell wall biosynthesis